MAATSSDGMQAIRTVIQKQGVSREAADIILKSWRPGTSKQYQPYIRKWIQYCHQRSIDPTNSTVGQALEFLPELFKKGLGYSSLNTARCALSCIITPNNTGSFGSQPLVVRFLKGVYESRPSVPRYVETWDVTVVLKFLAPLHPPSKLTLRELTLKLVMLVSLVSGQRAQSIQLLDINCMSQTETSCTFVITQNVKQSKPGIKQPVIKLEAYPIDDRLCVVTLLKEYLSRTAWLRRKHSQLFICYVKPFGPVSRDTISRWLMQSYSKLASIPQSLNRTALVQPLLRLPAEMQFLWRTY